MFNRVEKLTIPAEFPFPFQPYQIQDEFMRAIYAVIENGRIGIFESPTGEHLNSIILEKLILTNTYYNFRPRDWKNTESDVRCSEMVK